MFELGKFKEFVKKKIIGIIVSTIVVGLIISRCSNPEELRLERQQMEHEIQIKKEKDAEEEANKAIEDMKISEVKAQSYCQIRIKQVVNDPDSVEFDDYQVTLNPDGIHWTVDYNIRAKNAFGGVIRTSYLCNGINDSVQAVEK